MDGGTTRLTMLTDVSQPETYGMLRNAVADYMRKHPDEFLPFLTSDAEDSDGLMSPGQSLYMYSTPGSHNYGVS